MFDVLTLILGPMVVGAFIGGVQVLLSLSKSTRISQRKEPTLIWKTEHFVQDPMRMIIRGRQL
jgi:hypothetical protein|tara:strand:- start:406 stop:594 length:189 start_codon:yes stop_codon:yes gene_type:complete